MPGVHCSLEDISIATGSEKEVWVRDVIFEIGGVQTVRKKGDPVGNIMVSWRKARRARPDLFLNKRVWQSPTGFVNSVIYSWQQEEESARFANLLRLVDSLSTHWTEQASERNWLSQAVQACVPPGCTPLGQPTDTGFAQPAKAACRREHERQRYLLKQKSRQQGCKAVLKIGPTEILQAVDAMHSAFVSLNEESEAVVAEARACGWFHWRPNKEGSLVRADTQQWAQRHTEGSSRMGPDFRENRESWVEEGKVKPLEADEWKKVSNGPDPKEQQGDYFKPKAGEEPVLEIEAAEPANDFMTDDQLFGLNCALLHPSARTQQEELRAQMVLVTSQKSVRSKKEQPAQLTREERVAKWKAALAGQSVQARLAALVPQKGRTKKDKKKQVLKSLKKGIFKSASAKYKAAKNKKKGEKKAEKEKEKKEEKHKKEASAEAHKLVGQTVRCIIPDATRFWQNQPVLVLSFRKETGDFQVRHTASGTLRQLREQEMAPIPAGLLKASMPDKVNLSKLQKLQLENVFAQTGQLVQVADKTLLEGPELTASWFEVFYRGNQAGDRFLPGQVVYLEPHTLQAQVYAWQEGHADEQHEVEGLKGVLETARNDLSQRLVLAPIQAGGPEHWTALTFMRKHGEAVFTARHQDSLTNVHEGCRLQAEQTFRCLVALGVQCSQPDLPPTELPVNQGDAWSCGWHSVSRFEEAYREFRGEGSKRAYQKKESRREETNKFAEFVYRKCYKPPAGSSAASTAPPPFPPPPSEPPQPLGPTGPALAGSKDTGFGCPKCRYSDSGCLACNPAKALKYAHSGSK